MDGGREPAPGPSRSVPRAPAVPRPRTSAPSGSSHDQCLHDHTGHQHGHEIDEGGPELEPQPWGDHEATYRHDREARGDAGRPHQQEPLGPDRPHQPPAERALYHERDRQRDPHPAARGGWGPSEAKGRRRCSNPGDAGQVAAAPRHAPPFPSVPPFLSAFESSRISEYSLPPKPSSRARMVDTPPRPIFPSGPRP